MKKSTKKLQNSSMNGSHATTSNVTKRTTRTSSNANDAIVRSNSRRSSERSLVARPKKNSKNVAQTAPKCSHKPHKTSNPYPDYHLILASRSPRRRELLTELGCDFEVVPASDFAEPTAIEGESPESLVRRAA